jgi:hypothetical protein
MHVMPIVLISERLPVMSVVEPTVDNTFVNERNVFRKQCMWQHLKRYCASLAGRQMAQSRLRSVRFRTMLKLLARGQQ